MRIGKVCGSVWATKKCEKLTGAKLLVVSLDKEQLIATDTIGAGVGDTVLITLGSSARLIDNLPTDAAICGIVDRVDIAGSEERK